MAEILEAVLQLEISGFTAGLQQAAQQVTAFAQAIQGSMQAAGQAFQQQVQALNQVANATRQTAQVRTQAAKQNLEEMEEFRQELRLQLEEFRTINRQELAEVTSRNRLILEDTKRTSGENVSTYRQELAQIQQLSAAQRRVMIEAARDFAGDPALNPAERLEAVKQTNRLILADEQQTHALRLKELQSHHALELQAYKTQAEGVTTFWGAALARIMTSLRTLGGYFAASFIIGIPFAIGAWGKESVDTAIKMEALTASFKGITGSATLASRELEFLRTVSNRLGIDFLQTTSQFKNIEAAARGTKLEGERIRVIFEQVAMAQRVMGLTSDQAARGLLAIEQMISKGVISAEELRKQLSQAIPGSVGIMARALGVGTDELSKMMKNANLLTEDVLPKFGAQLEKELGAGLFTATQTAQATFARFGNNVRDISITVGEAILTILKPVIDTINQGFDLYNKAKTEAQKAINENLGPIRDKLPPIEGRDLQGLLERGRAELVQQQKILQTMNAESTAWLSFNRPTQEALDNQITLVASLQKAYDALLKRLETYKEAQADTGTMGGGQSDIPFAKQTKAIKEEVEKLQTSMGSLAIEQKNFPALFTGKGELEQARQKLHAIEQGIDKVTKAMATAKALQAGAIPDDMQAEVTRLNAEYAAQRKVVEGIEAAEKARKDQIREEERLEKERVANANKLATERIQIEEKMHIAIAAFEGDRAGKQLEILTQFLGDAKRVYADQTLTAKFEATERMRIAQVEAKAIFDAHDDAAAALRELDDEQEAFQNQIAALQAKGTKTRLDDFNASFETIRQRWQDALDHERITEDQMTQLVEAGATAARRIVTEENDKAAKEAEKSWRELSNTIESTLSGAFASILSGSKNLFEGVRDAFLKLLARLAADALTHAIIIPAIVQFLGGGGGSGGASSGSLFGGSGLGGGGTLGSTGGGGGAGGILGTATAFAGAGVQGYQLATGGSLFGAGTYGAGLMATELGTIGADYGAGIGASYIGQSTFLGEIGLGATSVGSVVGGIGAGIATGMILKQINNMIGIKGVAGSALAGAGGGALAGTIILPGIGTAIGAVVGAIGGALAGILSKPGKQPGFDIQGMQPGRVEYDDVIGLRVTQNFQILKDFHQKLGTDYEDFIAVINDGINQMFEGVLSQIRSTDPEVQRALIDPLNRAFESVASFIASYPKIGGDKLKDQVSVMMQDFAKVFENTATGALGELIDAVKKIDPVVKAFQQIITSLLQDIQELEQQRKALNDTLEGKLKNLREASMTPAEILRARQGEYAGLLAQFNAGDEATKIVLAPQIADLAEAILQLSQAVFNPANSFGDLTGIQGAIKQLQESLYTPAQTMAARQTDLANLLGEFRRGDLGVRTVLAPQISQLALQIMDLAKGVNVLTEQVALMQDFPAQLRAITEALYSPAQSYLSQRSQLTALMSEFRTASPERQLALEPQIAQLAAQILQLAKGQDVLGQDPQLLRQVQAELLSAVQEVQHTIETQVSAGTSDAAMLQATLERTQAEMIGVLREVEYVMAGGIAQSGAATVQALWQTAGQIIGTTYTMSNGIITATYATTNGVITAQYNSAGQLISTEHYIGGVLAGATNNVAGTVAGWSSALYGIQAQLIGQVASVRDTAWYSYTQLINALWAQIGIAQYEIQLLIASLYHLETVDAVVARALGVLGEMNARLGNPLQVDLRGSIGEQLQRDTLTATQQLLASQRTGTAATIGMLGKIAFGLPFEAGFGIGMQYTGYQHGGTVPFSMTASLHQGERIIPEWENRGGGGGRVVHIQVYGGTKDASQIADEVVKVIERRSGRLNTTTIQTSRR